MTTPHFILVAVENLRQARALALEALRQRASGLVVDKRVPAGYRSALPIGSTDFDNALATARLLQRESLMNCATMLSGIFGGDSGEAFERTYHCDPEGFKASLGRVFQAMGFCAAETLVRQRHTLAAAGDSWIPLDFDEEGFMDGLAEVRRFQDLLAGQYCADSYFYNPYARSARVPSAGYFEELSAYLTKTGRKLALVPVMVTE